MENNKPILEAAFRAWNEAADFRRNRRRYKRFTYGDQWSDMVAEGQRVMTAADRERLHGRRPMTNNLLRRLVKSVIGRYRYQRQQREPLEGAPGQVYRDNHLDELDCRALEEFLISGCTVQRVCRERRLRGDGVWVDMVSPDRFFVNRITDPRGWDTELVGMIHDWSLTETEVRLAGGDRRLAAAIRAVYGEIAGSGVPFPDTLTGGDSFLTAATGRCRVIEVWTLEASQRLRCHDTERASFFTLPASLGHRLEQVNRARRKAGRGVITSKWEQVTVWRGRWFAPDGTVLASRLSDSPDGSHPFRFRFYPMIDGEIHSLVEDVIDQQIYINELISLIDHVVSCSAKGVLLFPVDEKIPGVEWSDIAEHWSRPDAIIPVRGRSGTMPRQVSSSASDVGARELLATQMQMFEDVSGVTNALMGRSQSGGREGVEHYESMVRNAMIAIADILDTFDNFIAERNSCL